MSNKKRHIKNQIVELRQVQKIHKESIEALSNRIDELENISNDLESFDYKSIKTIEDAYKRNGKDYSKVMSHTKHIQAYIDLCEIVKAINNKSDFEGYWYPYFQVSTRSEYCSPVYGGVSYLHAFNDSSYTYTVNGSQLAFNTKEKAEYAVNQFMDVYRDYILGIE